jgi:hypothetical protein
LRFHRLVTLFVVLCAVLAPIVPYAHGDASRICEGRLTLHPGVPVSAEDQAGRATLYFTPYKRNRIALYDGRQWNVRRFSELSLSVLGLTGSTTYDVCAYDNSAAVMLEALAWASPTERVTSLASQDGVYGRAGATSRRYLSTIYINAAGGQTDDTFSKRYVWNYHQRVARPLQLLEATNSWTYTSPTYRQVNSAIDNQVDVVVGMPEVPLSLTAVGQSYNRSVDVDRFTAVGEDSTSTPVPGQLFVPAQGTMAPKAYVSTISILHKYPAAGRHYYASLEYSAQVGTTTGLGNGNSPIRQQTGLTGWIEG